MGQSLKPVPLSKKKKKTCNLYFLIKIHKTKLNCEYVLRGEQERTARASSNDPGYETMPNGIYYSSSNYRNKPAS